ncbi:GIY-YIG nuclease family protein [Xenorhabdus bovienii]|uniref:GIY-YIG nuclease family protein n=1 Tax=Xenorhabdus bovienii TaxID=40576 RepID=UPI0023B23282|nr:GIY-YIG nuclease family protein [Xenorhabdus bovienii]MDE9483410.1 GIY-YIG nuclease family protein [Xenorhabdus bovienii]MDE9557489.1 GIY-YIG nuclease family protein [Xenorhabdus bovienii]
MIDNEVYGATINLDWHDVINLNDIEFKDSHELIKEIPKTAGIYIFWRKFADTHECLYIGRASNLNRRIVQQLNAKKLVDHVQDAKKGAKLLSFAEIRMHQSCDISAYLDEVETFLIAEALSAGHNLFNSKKTKCHFNKIINDGNGMPNIFDDDMYLPKNK